MLIKNCYYVYWFDTTAIFENKNYHFVFLAPVLRMNIHNDGISRNRLFIHCSSRLKRFRSSNVRKQKLRSLKFIQYAIEFLVKPLMQTRIVCVSEHILTKKLRLWERPFPPSISLYIFDCYCITYTFPEYLVHVFYFQFWYVFMKTSTYQLHPSDNNYIVISNKKCHSYHLSPDY